MAENCVRGPPVSLEAAEGSGDGGAGWLGQGRRGHVVETVGVAGDGGCAAAGWRWRGAAGGGEAARWPGMARPRVVKGWHLGRGVHGGRACGARRSGL